jgi:hypothetical protein
MDGSSMILNALQADVLAARGFALDAASTRLLAEAYQARRGHVVLDKLLMRHTGLTPRQYLLSFAPGDVHVDAPLPTQLTAFLNRDYIADGVLPVVSVMKRSDKTFTLPVETYLSTSRLQIAGHRGRPAEISYGVTSSANYSVIDYGLMDFIGADEEANADAPLQPLREATRIVTNALALGRETRVAAVVFGTANYGTNTTALAGADRWDTVTGDPVDDLHVAIEAPLARPNVMVVGAEAWIKLINNPQVVAYIKSRGSDAAGPTPRLPNQAWFARAFDLDAVYVGRAKIVTSVEGQAITQGYVWGKSAALIRVEDAPNPRATSCFAFTYRFGGRSFRSEVIPDRMAGVRGGEWVKVTHSDDEKVIGGMNSGFLYTTVVS